MNNILETAIKNKIAIDMFDYLGDDSIEDIPYNIEYNIQYTKLLDAVDIREIMEYASNCGVEFHEDKKQYQMLTVATVIVFEKYFNDDFVCSPFTINQFQKALRLLQIDIWDAIDMKYVFNI